MDLVRFQEAVSSPIFDNKPHRLSNDGSTDKKGLY